MLVRPSRFRCILAFYLSLSLLRPSYAGTTAVVASSDAVQEASTTFFNPPLADAPYLIDSKTKRKPIRSIHVTSWIAGSKKQRAYLDELLENTVVNSLTIDIKEYEGEVYIPGVALAEKYKAYVPAIPDLQEWIADLRKRGVYTVARIVVFKDNIAPRRLASMGVHNSKGELWEDRHKITWLDPYDADARRYNLLIAYQAAMYGFDEIQFDYIRFPTDGNLGETHFDKPYRRDQASEVLVEFLAQARQLLHPLGVKISIDVFGLTTSVTTGMGIGQLMLPMSRQVDYVCPMVYPSHYYGGEYGLKSPVSEPYKTVFHGLRDATKLLGTDDTSKLRPYLQDFSIADKSGLKVKYGPKEVRAQIQATADLGITDWSLWNARVRYTRDALLTPVEPNKMTDIQSATPSVHTTDLPNK